jgi:hypothetical protein
MGVASTRMPTLSDLVVEIEVKKYFVSLDYLP